ncbi:hypothetical protein E4U43_003479 [Claviceps pusilla]|uniref:Uncharacterized protein n=1 Tax=Claviceps pusilla TaxID=123648 RepID=A0A9P7N725_9HYPO|nr:hypothetical protein E4U43_003479 [Claviceps pusilla]
MLGPHRGESWKAAEARSLVGQLGIRSRDLLMETVELVSVGEITTPDLAGSSSVVEMTKRLDSSEDCFQ